MPYRALRVTIALLLLVACRPAQEATPPLTPTVPPASSATPLPEQSAATADAVQADTPTVAPAQPSPAVPTVTLPLPTPAPAATSTPEPAPAPQASGSAGFRDNLAVGDQFVLNLTDVPAPPEGQAYQGWLVGDDGALTDVGVLNLNPDGSVNLAWNSPDSENLLSRYARFQVTLEPAGGSASPSGPVVLAGGLDGEALASARRLFVRNDAEPVTPLNTAFSLGLKAQTDVAVQHVQNAVNAAAIGALPEMRVHLDHVVNILEGAAGSRFGDYNGNGVAENPGDGFGVKGYASEVARLLSGQEAVAGAAAEVQTQSTTMQDKCLQILALQDMAAAAGQLGELKTLADQLKAGPVAGLYQAAQEAVSFQVGPGE